MSLQVSANAVWTAPHSIAKFHCLQAAGTLMTDLKDQDDAAAAVPVIRKWLRWLATPKVASPLERHNE